MNGKKILIATTSTLAALLVVAGFVASYQVSSPDTWWRTHQRQEACRTAILDVLADKEAVIPKIREEIAWGEDVRDYKWGVLNPPVSAKNAFGAPRNAYAECTVSVDGHVTALKIDGDPMPVYRRR